MDAMFCDDWPSLVCLNILNTLGTAVAEANGGLDSSMPCDDSSTFSNVGVSIRW